MTSENRGRLLGEFRSPDEESSSLKLQLDLFEEAGVHDLLIQLQREVQYTAPRSKSSIELEARVLNNLAVRSNVEIWKLVHDLDLPGVLGLRFYPIKDDLTETATVRTPKGPFFRLSFFYDIGTVVSFAKIGRRDEVSTNPTSYQAIVVETSPSREMRVYHRSFRRSPEIVNGQKVQSDLNTVDLENAFVFPYYSKVVSGTGYDLNNIRLKSGWSTQQSSQIGILDRLPSDVTLKIPEAAHILFSKHLPLHRSK